VLPQTIDQCRRAFDLAERSTYEPIAESELRSIEFSTITDAGDSAFTAAAHVGWNLFAPINGLHSVDEFDNANQMAHLVGSVAGQSEIDHQVDDLKKLIASIEQRGTV
jgi:hypothetical protein